MKINDIFIGLKSKESFFIINPDLKVGAIKSTIIEGFSPNFIFFRSIEKKNQKI